ncbi:hypothetical protein K8O93_18705 [Gordonia bronchialis]|uniref:hypothetical protein n=1 Tax=Gordonia bronchialis TaxID=2054 RepID=UPI001CC0F06F|nr:hypothetical protein [Gordonia bronchialis]UAK37177.1 hypothetical protein K8O93_18705 [Gordonia bronchialis]
MTTDNNDKNTDDNQATVRIAMTVSPIDARRLKQAGVDYGAPAAVVARALVNYGLDHLDSEAIDTVLTAAAAAEKQRRSEAARLGGRHGGGSNKKKET